MNALLVLTVGRTDVQLVENETRREFSKKRCAFLHDEIERREGDWRFVPSPSSKSEQATIDALPEGSFDLCTPKLDAIREYLIERNVSLAAALILGTRRDAKAEEPRFACTLLAIRLREYGIKDVREHFFLTDKQSFENRANPRDSIISRKVVSRLDQDIRNRLVEFNPARIILATTGGMPPANKLIEEVVRLHAAHTAIDLLAVPESEDRAISRCSIPEPTMSYQARRHALELIDKGNFLAAWGAVQHLDTDEIEHRWTRVVQWLYRFASSLPIEDESCDLPILTHRRMAVRAALRVELALRAGDIPRAVHGTVAFFESALWDHLQPHLTCHPENRRLHQVLHPTPPDDLIRRGDQNSEDRGKPFTPVDIDNIRWYDIDDSHVCGIKLAKYYLKQMPLMKLGQAVAKIRDLRNDVAHNEPTPELMQAARDSMVQASLWSTEGRFLTQPLIRDVLSDLGEPTPERLCENLLTEVRSRLLDISFC